MKRLIQISVFFRNDKEGGIGLTLTEACGDLDFIMETIQTAYNVMWQEAYKTGSIPQLIRDLRVQLGIIGYMKEKLCLAQASIVIGNVFLLEHHGYMISDEYNGLQLAYIEN